MGEAQGTLFEPEFNRSVKVETSQQRITSHAGAVLLRELDHKLGLVESLASQLVDPRDPNRIRYTAVELLRERMYALAMGEENQDDLDRLAHDPALRMAAWDRPGQGVLEERLASQPTQSRLLAWLAKAPQNREAVRHALFDWTHRHLRSTRGARGRAVNRATVDIDSFAVRVHGEQHAPVTTATCVRSCTIRRWPASPLKETTTARCVAIGSATASSTPRCGKARCTPRKGRDVSCDAWWSMLARWRGASTCGWTLASPSVRCWMT